MLLLNAWPRVTWPCNCLINRRFNDILVTTRETCSAKTTDIPTFATSPSTFSQKLRHRIPRPHIPDENGCKIATLNPRDRLAGSGHQIRHHRSLRQQARKQVEVDAAQVGQAAATLVKVHALWQQRRHLAALPGAMVVLKMPPVHAGCAIAAEMRQPAC